MSVEEMTKRIAQLAQYHECMTLEEGKAIISSLRAAQEMRDAIREPNLGNAQYAAQAWDAATKGDEG